MVHYKAAIFGCMGPELKSEEMVFFSESRPVGFILFARNCVNPRQLKKLIKDLRASINNANAPVLIDQEGGRVVRLGAPHWRDPPAAKVFAELANKDVGLACEALNLNIRLIGHELRELGINVNCLPLLDVPLGEVDPIIGDRALGTDVQQVSTLGRIVCDSLMQEGVLPIIKHIPGHGRANVDSHKILPIVTADWEDLSQTDFLPFKLLRDMPFAMTAHIIYSAIDANYPATISRKIIQDVIRKEIGFRGILISDDLSMRALKGSLAERARASLEAGCDIVLHCNGDMSEMLEIADVIYQLPDESCNRVHSALARTEVSGILDKIEAFERLTELGIG